MQPRDSLAKREATLYITNHKYGKYAPESTFAFDMLFSYFRLLITLHT